MADVNKVLKSFNVCNDSASNCSACPYNEFDNKCTEHLFADIFEILKDVEKASKHKKPANIVYCCECAELQEWDGRMICMRLGSYYGEVRPNDYCSYGVPKAD